MLFTRPDGVRVRDESANRRILPFLMPSRTEAMVQLEQKIDVTETLRYLDRVNSDRKARRVSLFHVLLCAMARAHHMRPKLNRFVVGQRIYQRHKLEYSFGVKKKLDDEAVLTAVKLPFEPDDTIETVIDRIDAAISKGRGEQKTQSEREMRLVASLPRFLTRFVVWALGVLDYFNLMPASMIAADELYCSMFVANLGSVGLDAPFHHLYNWGTAPLFCSIGKVERTPVIDARGQIVPRDMLTIRWSFDERIADGFYCARALDLFKDFLCNPEVLEKEPGEAERAAEPDKSAAASTG